MTYSVEEIKRADDMSLSNVVSQMGYTVRRVGSHFTTKEMDSFIIYNDRTWCRHSHKSNKGKIGGGVLDFLIEYGNMTFQEAAEWALSQQGQILEGTSNYPIMKQVKEPKKFVLPERNNNNKRIIAYLIQQRKLSYQTVIYYIGAGLIYESKEHHNLVCLGKDCNGTVKFASMRGTYDVADKEPFKCDVEGSNKKFGVNLYRTGSKMVVVSEAFIDAISYVEIERDNQSSLLVLAMLDDAPLETFLSEHPEIESILLALDHDEAGRKAMMRIQKRYEELGYEVKNYKYPEMYKDVNRYLQSKELNRRKIQSR